MDALETTSTAAPIEAATASEAAEGQSADAAASGDESAESRRARVIRLLREGRRGRAQSAAAPPLTPAADEGPEGAEETEGAPDSPDASTGESGAAEVPAADKSSQEDRELELRLARVSRDLRDARADALEAREKVQRLDALTAKIQKAKGDPLAAVEMLPELIGMDYGQLADAIIANESRFRDKHKYAELPPDVREELEFARQERLSRTEREQQEQQKAAQTERFTRYKESAATFLENNRTDYPLTHALGWGAGQIAREAITRNSRDARAIASQLETNLRSELTEALSKPEVLRALIAVDKTLVGKIQQSLSTTKPDKSHTAASFRSGSQQGSAEGPRSLTNGATASDTATTQSRKDERRRRFAEAFKATYSGG